MKSRSTGTPGKTAAARIDLVWRSYAIAPWYPDTTAVLAALMRRHGQGVESQSLAQTPGAGEAVGAAHVYALFHLLCGEVDQGADWAQKAIEEGDLSMIVLSSICRMQGAWSQPLLAEDCEDAESARVALSPVRISLFPEGVVSDWRD